MNKLDNIINKLANQEPILLDEEALCNSIMENLPEQLPAIASQIQHKESLWIGIARWSTSIAAMLLLVLYIGQNLEIQAPADRVAVSSYIESYQKEYGQTISTSTSLPAALQRIAAEKESKLSIYNLKRQFANNN